VRQLNTCNADLGDCRTDLAACQAEPSVVFPGDGVDGPALSYHDNGDGTFTDNNTLFMWEKKDTSGGIHDVNNTYTWSNAFAVFLAALNSPPCFAGHCDWRLPNIKELQSIVDYSKSNPAASVPGSTAAGRLLVVYVPRRQLVARGARLLRRRPRGRRR
jgi:hypothetical protein